jgi:hypothetical protein
MKVKVFELILKEQHIISNLQQIKELLLLNSVMGFILSPATLSIEILRIPSDI